MKLVHVVHRKKAKKYFVHFFSSPPLLFDCSSIYQSLFIALYIAVCLFIMSCAIWSYGHKIE